MYLPYHMWLLLQLAQKIGQICCYSIYFGPTFNCKYQVVFFCKCYLLDFLYMLLLHSKRLDGKKTMLYGMSDISTIHGPRFSFLKIIKLHCFSQRQNQCLFAIFSKGVVWITKLIFSLWGYHATIQIIYLLVIT